MTKKQILMLFERNKGEIISGEEIAGQLGMSRTAVWKAINLLREEGYDIESVRKKGYKLNPNSDILSTVKIRDYLDDEGVLAELEVHKTIDSTNKRLKLLAIEGAKEWTVVASEEQLAGKGREQKVFLSPEGKGVYMSILLRPNMKWNEKGVLLNLICESVREVLEAIVHRTVEVSNQGDLSIEGRKVAGILTEISVEGESERIESVVVGIGINVYDQREIHTEDNIRIALSDVIGSYCNRSELIAHVINCLTKKIQLRGR